MSKNCNRVRNFDLLIYEEYLKLTVSTCKALAERGVIRAYYFIKHDPEQEEKQIHWHFCIEFYNAKSLSSVAKNFNIPERFVQVCGSVRLSVCYLIHKYEANKIKYPVSYIETNDKERCFMFLNARNDNDSNDYRQFFIKACSVIKTNPNRRWCDVFDLILRDKDVDSKFLARANSVLYKYWDSFNYEYDRNINTYGFNGSYPVLNNMKERS